MLNDGINSFTEFHWNEDTHSDERVVTRWTTGDVSPA